MNQSRGSSLERITEAELNLSGQSLNAGEVRPVRWWSLPLRRIDCDSVTGSAAVNRPRPLSVGHIESLNAEFKLMPLIPGHRKRLGYPYVENNVSRQPERR